MWVHGLRSIVYGPPGEPMVQSKKQGIANERTNELA